jgi:hypothetical protein
MLNLDHAGGQSAKTAQRFETWHRLRYYVFEPELQRPLFQHFDVASRFLQVFFPKRKTSLQRITPQAMNKSSPFLPDPMEDGKLAINVFTGGFRTASILEALDDIRAGPTNMDDFGIWKHIQPEGQRERIAWILPTPGDLQPADIGVANILSPTKK